MTTPQDDTAPSFRFKRRKIAHPRKLQSLDSDASPTQLPDVPLATNYLPNLPAPSAIEEDEEDVPNLKEILRQRKRPQEHLKEAARKAAEKKAGPGSLVLHSDAGALQGADQYSGRFVAQTGQVVDKDDEQMTAYVEARLAEKNHRQYGWPIPKHLQGLVATLSSSEKLPVSGLAEREDSAAHDAGGHGKNAAPERDTRLAAGLGKLQEIDLGPEASAKNLQRIEEARRRLEGGSDPVPVEQTSDAKRGGKPGRQPRRQRNRRNSEDLRRDMLVEAVLREAKLEYFEEDKPPSPPANGVEDTDEAFYEQFRREYESQESRNQRKPAPPPSGPKGVKEPPKGPKLGGSRSARAAMREREEQAAKGKR